MKTTEKVKAPIDWLLEGPPFVRYRVLIDLMEMDSGEGVVKSAYEEMVADPLIRDLIAQVNGWEDQVPIKRHNDAAHLLHKLTFLAGIGVKRGELGSAVKSILSHQSPEGPLQIKIVIPRAFGRLELSRFSC